MFKNKIYFWLNKEGKKNLMVLAASMLIASLLEMLSLGLIFPISGLILDNQFDNIMFIEKINLFREITPEQILAYALLMFFIFYLIKIFFLTWFTWFESKFIYSFKQNVSGNLFKGYLHQNFNFFQGRNSAEFLRNITTEIDVATAYLYAFLKLSLETVVITGILVVLVFINPLFTLSIVAMFFIVSLFYMLFFRKKFDTWGRLRQSNQEKRIQFMQEGFEGVKNVKLLGREDFFFNKFRKHNLDLYNIATITNFVKNLPRLLFELIGITTLILVYFFYYDGNSNSNPTIIIQILAVYVAASFRILPSVNRILSSLQTLKLSTHAVDKIYLEFQSFTPKEEKENNSTTKFVFKKNILIDIKSFKYNEKSKFELKNIKLNFKQGEHLGIIGKSGSGKSSIVDIITGVLKSNDTNIMVDNKSIYHNLKGWQKLIGYVPQKVLIVNDTFKNNILYGLDEDKFSDTEIIELIKKMSLETLFNRLPSGLESKLDERGLNLSVGEIQRIGICRALIYNPSILFLDEATSSLDTFTETQILEELNLYKEKTLVSIAHRINSLRNCDTIYCIDNGKVIDQGSFSKFSTKN